MRRAAAGGLLVVRTGAMGDVLHALPAVAALRRLRPAMRIEWVVEPRWAPLLVDAAGRGPVVDGVRLAETRRWGKAPVSWGTARSVGRLWGELGGGRYDVAVDVQGTLRSAVLGRMAEAGELVGFEEPRERAAAWLYGRRVARRGVHVVEQNAALLGAAVGVELEPERGVELPVRAEAEAWAEGLVGEVGRKVAVLAASAGWGAKQWPAGRFGELAVRLREMGFVVLVNAAGLEDAVAAEVVRASAGAAAPVRCDVAELVALVRRAALVVGGDSGPVHLAAALGAPVVGLFGPTDPARNGPWGGGRVRMLRDAGSVTSYKRAEVVEAGLGSIGVEVVVEAVEGVASPFSPCACSS